jgi:hypothetical protein
MHHYLLLQRRDWLQRFLRDRALPILQQLTPMRKGPGRAERTADLLVVQGHPPQFHLVGILQIDLLSFHFEVYSVTLN